MKGKVIKDTIFDERFLHCKEEPDVYYVRRLIVEEADNLAFTYGNYCELNNFFTGFSQRKSNYEVLAEVEVPDELVEKALAAIRVQKELADLEKDCKETFKKYSSLHGWAGHKI